MIAQVRNLFLALLNMAAVREGDASVAAPGIRDRAPTTPDGALPEGALESEDVYALDPVMSFLEAVPWDGVSKSFRCLQHCFACVHVVLQMLTWSC